MNALLSIPDMLTLHDFVFLEDGRDNAGHNIILCTNPPFIYSKVWNFRSAEEFDSFMQRHDAAMITGYRIAVTYEGALDYGGNTLDIQYMLCEMADFYYDQRIKDNLNRYKRYLI